MARYEDVHELCFEPKRQAMINQIYQRGGYFKSPDEPVFDMERLFRLLKGAIDTHTHAGLDPNIFRPLDEVEIAIQAGEIGMGGVAFKNGYAPSAYTVRYSQKLVDQWAARNGKESPRLIGGIVLGYPVGGLNLAAVRNALKVGGRIVWTPFVDSSHHHRMTGQSGGINMIGEDDRVVPELREIFQLIAKYDVALALSHHSTRERFIMIDDAREEGVKRILVLHPTLSLTKMSIDQMKTAAAKSAYLELCCLDFAEPEVVWDEFIEVIRQVGADHIVLATDCGNASMPPPAAQYKAFIYRLIQSGISDADIEKMAKLNPRRLIF